MGATKYEAFSQDVIEFAELFKALSHPARLKTVIMIANKADDVITTKDILDEINLCQSSVSRHLKVLAQTGIIYTKVITKNNKSCIAYKVNSQVITVLNEKLKKIVLEICSNYDEQEIKKYFTWFNSKKYPFLDSTYT